jgi:hypothetical protein
MCAGTGREAEIGERIGGLRPRDRFRRNINARHRGGIEREFRRAVAHSATGVEDTLSGGEAAREGVSREVFGPEIVVHLAGNDALPGEL